MADTNSGVTGGGGAVWQSAPETSDRGISADLSGKGREGKKENGVEKKENREREGGKMKMEWGKVTKWGEDFFLSTFQNDWHLFGSTKMEIFYREKAFHTGKRIIKS